MLNCDPACPSVTNLCVKQALNKKKKKTRTKTNKQKQNSKHTQPKPTKNPLKKRGRGALKSHKRTMSQSATGTETELWSQSGEQGQDWIQTQVSVTPETVGNQSQIIFRARKALGIEGDIAIDDVEFTSGLCRSSGELTGHFFVSCVFRAYQQTLSRGLSPVSVSSLLRSITVFKQGLPESNMHTLIHINTHTNTLRATLTHRNLFLRTHAHIYTERHARAQTHTYTRARWRTH